MSGKLPAGQNYLIVQHPMADNQFDIVVSGDYVRDLKLNNGTNFFKLTAREACRVAMRQTHSPPRFTTVWPMMIP